MKIHKDTRAVIRHLEREARECRSQADECERKGLCVLAISLRNLALKAEREADHIYRRFDR